MNSYGSRIHSYLIQACEPSPKCFQNELDRKLQFKRNKSFLVMQITFLAMLSLYLACIKEKLDFPCYSMLSKFLLIIVVFLLTCRSHPTLFKFFYAGVFTIYAPMMVYIDPKSVFAAWTSVSIAPTLLLYYSGCHVTYISQVIIQLSFMGLYYKEKMIEHLDITDPRDFMGSLTYLATFAIFSNCMMVYRISINLTNTFRHEIILGESQRKELEVQKTFILSFSHEIRNLINTLTGNIQLSLLEKGSSTVKGYLQDAEIGAGLLLQLINNILDTGNLEVGELDINQSNQLIHSTLEKVWRMCAYLLKAKNLQGRLRIVKNIPRNLMLDHERFMQILINLIVNAVKFTDKGSVDIELEWIPDTKMVTEEHFYPSPFDDEDEGVFEKDKAISFLNDKFTIIGLDKKKWSSDRYNILHGTGPGLLKVAVTDTGCGVLPDNLPFAFHKFSSQIFGDKDSKKLGTTIGLYVTKELCNKMGGDIKIFSKIDRGTSFIACIPAEQLLPNRPTQRRPTLDSTMPTSMTQLHKLRAMIVDDLQFNIIVLTSYLERMKVDIANTAINGQDAFNKYVESVQRGMKFDIVTMDVEMPVMDGKESARKIREYEKENNLDPCFLVMISGNVTESEISQCMKYSGGALANHFLKKPAMFEDLFRLINEHFFLTSQSSIASLY